MKVVLAGGTGFIGKALHQRLMENGHEVILLTRSSNRLRFNLNGKTTIVSWDGRQVGDWAEQIEKADAFINLAGDPIVEGRWTRAKKERILTSRLQATRTLVAAIKHARKKPSVFINASAVGYYGNVAQGEVKENHPKGEGFLADVCEQWENEAQAVQSLGIRLVLIRTGVVLGRKGGALKKMITPFRFFMGGTLGSGEQWLPWIHIDDVTGGIIFSLEKYHVFGPINLTSPHPVPMREFSKALGKALHRPSWASVPSFVLRATLGELADTILEGQKVVPEKLLKAGYKFHYPSLQNALNSFFKKD